MNESSDTSLPNESAGKRPATPPHPVVDAVERLIHEVLDTEECWRAYVPSAEQSRQSSFNDLLSELEEVRKDVETSGVPAQAAFIKRLFGWMRRLNRVAKSRRASTLAKSLFLGLYSAFDAFIGNLLRALFERRPELFNSLGGTVDVKDVLGAADITVLRAQILDGEIDSLRRKSYSEQFRRPISENLQG